MLIETWHWLALGTILIVLEIFLPTFASLWFGLSALCVGLLLWLMPELAFSIQLLIWATMSIILTLAWFKFIKPLSVDKTHAGLVRESTIGQTGMVIQTGLEHGQIKVRFSLPLLGNDEWFCRSTEPVQVGDRVQVIDILGNDFLVKPYSS